MNKFEKIYELTKDDLGCPDNCKICEKGPLIFLPGEMEFLSKKFKISKNKFHFLKINNRKIYFIPRNEKNCIFYKFGKCIKRDFRPLDCRTYPVIPCLKNKKISVKLDDICPVTKNNKIKNEFIKKSEKAWKTINPPVWWMKIYEKL